MKTRGDALQDTKEIRGALLLKRAAGKSGDDYKDTLNLNRLRI